MSDEVVEARNFPAGDYVEPEGGGTKITPQFVAFVQQALTGKLPDLTAPNLTPPGGEAPTFFGAYYEWMTTQPPSWDDIAWMVQQWGGTFVLKGVGRVDDALRAVDAILDRIVHNAHRIDLKGDSMRRKDQNVNLTPSENTETLQTET